MSSLLAFDEAFQRLLARAQPLQGIEVVPTMQADGRVLAEPVISMMDIPAWDTSQMDGYAVRAAELEADPDRVFPISQRIPAGHPGLALRKGTVARIFTGAALPVGADAVVMQEDAEEVPLKDGSKGVRFRLRVQPQPGELVCRKADNVQAGTEILPAGTALTPAAIGLVASVGLPELTVRRRPRVACFFTGDELLMPGQPLWPGAIYNSNRFVLAAALRRLGCEVIDLGIVPDSLEATRASLRQAALDADLIITAGGVSVGEEDHVRPAVEAEGEIDLWRIAIKPGKPLAYGRVRRTRDAGPEGYAHFIGLPGNPVSSFITFLLLVRPFILKLQGARSWEPRRIQMTADFAWPRPDKRREFLRAVLQPDGKLLKLFRNQGSAVLTSAVIGDGLIDNPPGQPIQPGDTVQYIPFAELLGLR